MTTDLRKTEICYLLRVTQPEKIETVTLEYALKSIQSKKYHDEIEMCRDILANQGDDAFKQAKVNNLPTLHFNGIFKDRLINQNFVKSSGLFHFDIDDLKTAKETLELKKELSLRPECVFLFVSPGALGLKGALRIDPDKIKNNDDFKAAFSQVDDYFKRIGVVIDQSCKDSRRACFVSSDADIYINYDANVFDVDTTKKPEQHTKKEYARYSGTNAEGICIERVKNILLSATEGTKHETRLRAGKLAGGFIAGGLIDESKMTDIIEQLSDSIAGNGDTNRSERQTLLDGIEHGKKYPITNFTKDPVLIWSKPEYKIILNNQLNLLKHLPDSHLMKRMALQVSNETNLPINTVFIMGLGVFSSMANRVFCSAYKTGSRLPIGLYAVAEQPPGAAKSWCLRSFQAPFYKMASEHIYKETELKPSLFLTNTTSEALDKSLVASKGFFSAVSSEQGLFNSMLGMSYSGENKANNNDTVLNGFDGGFVATARVTREGYIGNVSGSVVCFAQPGSIEKVLTASGNTGISERFIMLSENHNLGKRDHSKEAYHDYDLYNEYASVCSFYEEALIDVKSLGSLNVLTISKEGFSAISSFRNEIEPFLSDGEKFSHSFLRGFAAKIDIQIIKIAATLQVFDGGNVVSDSLINAAIGIARDIINYTYTLGEKKEVFGDMSEFSAIISYLEKANKPKTEREMANSLRKTKPFSEMSNGRSDVIKKTIKKMVEQGRLKQMFQPDGRVLFTVS